MLNLNGSRKHILCTGKLIAIKEVDGNMRTNPLKIKKTIKSTSREKRCARRIIGNSNPHTNEA